jgi:hypothetical protein
MPPAMRDSTPSLRYAREQLFHLPVFVIIITVF